MRPSRTERLNRIVAALSEYIGVVRGYDMQETAVLLDMAKLDLQTRIHAISDREFRALCDALEFRQRGVPADGSETAAKTVPDMIVSDLPRPVASQADCIPFRSRRIAVPRRRPSLAFSRTRKES